MADPKSSYEQSSFLGGEWGPLSQGRSDLPAYHQALKVHYNEITVEEGASTRRSGTEWLAPTYQRGAAKLLPYTATSAGDPVAYVLEFTNNNLRMYYGTALVFSSLAPATVTASSVTTGVLSLTLDSAVGFSVGDNVRLIANTLYNFTGGCNGFRNRVMTIATINYSTGVITLNDDVLGITFNSSTTITSGDLNGLLLFQILREPTVYANAGLNLALSTLRIVQTGPSAQLLSAFYPPYTVSIAGNPIPTLSIAATAFVDGPYLDPQGGLVVQETGTVSGYSGSITFTPATTTFTSEDVGRCIRLFSQPPAWASGTTYTYGEVVTDTNGQWWTSIATAGTAYANANVGITPGTLTTIGGIQVMLWAPAPAAGQWAWGTITAQATTSCTVSLTTPLLAANSTGIFQWQLGVFKANQYPTCGIYYDGRLVLGGAVPNRFDMSVSNDPFTFSPTTINNIVEDNSAISETLNSKEAQLINWFAADHQGLLAGTLTGETLIQASVLGDPLTPTNVQAHEVTNYGSAISVEPKRIGMALAFVQRYGRRVIEYLADAFSQRYTGRHINEFAKHLTEAGVAEMAYQEETAPILWCRMFDGTLAGCTYRRVSRFVTEAPVFQAWHRHAIGGSNTGAPTRLVQSICVVPSPSALSDTLYLATSDTSNANWYVEILNPLFEAA